MKNFLRTASTLSMLALISGCSATPAQVAEGIAAFALVEGARHEYIKGCENTWTSDLECNARYDETRASGIQRHNEALLRESKDEQAELSRSLADYLEEHQP